MTSPSVPGDALTSDERFDELLPPSARQKSRHYWTPVTVAGLAARRLVEHGARSVLDVGCGPGKFCLVAAASHPALRFHGIDQRPTLIATASRLAERLELANAVFSVGNATDGDWGRYDGFYFFNPFAENVFEAFDRYDTTLAMSRAKLDADLARVEQLLGAAPLGTVVVTYNGLGGPIPSSYDLVHDEPAGSDSLRTWVRNRPVNESWTWLELVGYVKRVGAGAAGGRSGRQARTQIMSRR
jgi:SAM-dependent methyltransferase